MATTAENPPLPTEPPEWEKAKKALEAIQPKEKEKTEEKKPTSPADDIMRYGGPVGYTQGFEMNNFQYPPRPNGPPFFG